MGMGNSRNKYLGGLTVNCSDGQEISHGSYHNVYEVLIKILHLGQANDY